MSTYAKVVLGILWAIVIVANIAAGFIPQFKPLPVRIGYLVYSVAIAGSITAFSVSLV